MKKHSNDDSFSLFDIDDPTPDPLAAATNPTHDPLVPATSVIKQPIWEYTISPHIDFIADEQIVAFCYSLEELESHSGYSRPILKQIMQALAALASSTKKSLHHQAFTIYGGDIIATGVYVVGFAVKTASLVDFLADYMRRAPAYQSLESCSSTPFIPLYRYDNGYIIEYSEEEEGTSYVDTEEYYGTGLTIYRRLARPADLIFGSRSVFGILRRAE
jgi:hypothetical protein